jgi:iron complex outermembrane receptor protein
MGPDPRTFRHRLQTFAGYSFPGDSQLAGVELQVNAVNLTDVRYIAALGSDDFFNTAESLKNILQAWPPKQIFGTVRQKF